MTNYRICTRCVMDTTDPNIEFDEQGVCNHCNRYDRLVRRHILPAGEREKELSRLVETIKAAGRDRDYDCVVGVSGGVDSTYVAYTVKKLGLRPLAVHLDNGWDSELAVKNIENVLKTLGIDLYTHVIDWEEFRDLQLSFLKASTPDSEIPTDHAIFALMYQMAKKTGVRYVIAGFNVRTESHHPWAWSQGYLDYAYIRTVHRRFGTRKLITYPHMGFWRFHWYLVSLRMINILNYIDYRKEDAMKVLENELGWKYYGGKHYESIYTRFYQGYILPRKFGFDKRKTHLSSLICSGEITRDGALRELKNDPYPPALQEEDREYVIKKFGLSPSAFEEIMALPRKSYEDYNSIDNFFQSWLYRKMIAHRRKNY
jgi:N-acetyl sugar amidotransferase